MNFLFNIKGSQFGLFNLVLKIHGQNYWSWLVFKIEKKILNSTDNETFGFEPTNEGGGCEKATDDKGSYNIK